MDNTWNVLLARQRQFLADLERSIAEEEQAAAYRQNVSSGDPSL